MHPWYRLPLALFGIRYSDFVDAIARIYESGR
jgi:hypothetical protein